MSAVDSGIAFPLNNEAAADSSAKQERNNDGTKFTAAITVVCRSALVKSPAASRAALAKHRAFIDPSLVEILEIVGNYPEECGRTPLHLSVAYGDIAMAQSLIAAGALIDIKDTNGATPLDLATDDACRAILEHHAAVLATTKKDPTALISAATAHCAYLSAANVVVPMTALILRAHQLAPSFLWVPSHVRTEVFKWAGYAFIAQIAATTQPFAELSDDCAGDILEFFDMTMTRVEMLHVTMHCASPRACAWVHEILTAAITVKATSDLAPAVEKGDRTTVQDCLVKGADVNARIRFGDTVLIVASMQAQTAIIQALLDAGADVDACDDNGTTALMWASIYGHPAVVKMLLGAGADKEATDSDGITAFMKASQRGYTAIVELLLEAGASKNAKDKNGNTALILASSKGHTDTVKVLLQAGVDMDAKTDYGFTALMPASVIGHTAVVRLLLEAGADKDATDKNGNTALMSASTRGHTDIVKLFLEAGADKNARDDEGQTASDHAYEKHHMEVVAILDQ